MVVYGMSSTTLQVSISSYASLALLAYICINQPMETLFYNNLAIFNEVILLVVTNWMLLYTDFVN